VDGGTAHSLWGQSGRNEFVEGGEIVTNLRSSSRHPALDGLRGNADAQSDLLMRKLFPVNESEDLSIQIGQLVDGASYSDLQFTGPGRGVEGHALFKHESIGEGR